MTTAWDQPWSRLAYPRIPSATRSVKPAPGRPTTTAPGSARWLLDLTLQGGDLGGDLDSARSEARGLAAKGKLGDAAAVFEAARGHAAGDRERFLWDLEKARLCVDAGRADLGMPLLLHLDKLARNASLDSWEPVICIDLTVLLLRGDAQQGPGGDPERAALRKDWETRLARLDMRAAVELVKPPAEAGGT